MAEHRRGGRDGRARHQPRGRVRGAHRCPGCEPDTRYGDRSRVDLGGEVGAGLGSAADDHRGSCLAAAAEDRRVSAAFLGLPYLLWAGGCVVVALLFALIWPFKLGLDGMTAIALRWLHPLVWLVLAVSFLVRGAGTQGAA